jgi:phosphohistidine phosphatase SixA
MISPYYEVWFAVLVVGHSPSVEETVEVLTG